MFTDLEAGSVAYGGSFVVPLPMTLAAGLEQRDAQRRRFAEFAEAKGAAR